MMASRHRHVVPQPYVTFAKSYCSQLTSLSSVANRPLALKRRALARKLPYTCSNIRSEARCGDVPVGLSILFSHRCCDGSGRKKDVGWSCCFGVNSLIGLCDRVCTRAVWLYPCECVLHLHNAFNLRAWLKVHKYLRLDE